MLSGLPLELLSHIASYLTPRDLISLSSVNRHLNSWSRDTDLWVNALKRMSASHPDIILDLDSTELLREIPDLMTFYLRVIQPNMWMFGVWIGEDGNVLLKVKVDIAMCGIVGHELNIDYSAAGLKEKIQFIVPIDVDTYTCNLLMTECTRGCSDSHVTCSLVHHHDQLHMKCSYVDGEPHTGTLQKLPQVFGNSVEETTVIYNRLKPLKTFAYPVLKPGLFSCKELNGVKMFLESDRRKMYLTEIGPDDARRVLFRAHTNNPVDLRGILQLLLPSPDRRLNHDIINEYSFDNVNRKENPAGEKDLSDLRELFRYNRTEPSHVGLTDEFKYLDAFSCSMWERERYVITLFVVTSPDNFSVLQKVMMGNGSFYFTRVPGIRTRVEVIES